jgi:hypothetical protein
MDPWTRGDDLYSRWSCYRIRPGGGGRSTPANAATSRRRAERRVLEHAGLVLDQLDAAVEGAVLDHL